MPSATYTVLDLLGPDERLLWSGEPDLDALKRRSVSTWGRVPTILMLLFALALLAWLLNQRFGIVDWAGAIALHRQLPGSIATYVIATVALLLAVAVLAPRLQLGRVAVQQRRLARYGYALTDQRLLVVKSGRIARELRPEDVGDSSLHLHDDHIGDLSIRHLNMPENNPDGLVVFRSIAEPAALKRRIDDWVAEHLEHADRAVGEFIAGQRSGKPAAAATRRIVNPQFGIRIDVPRAWHVTVRHRREPYRTGLVMDVEHWREPDPGSNWNVMRAAGAMGTSLELHMDAGDPVIGYQDLIDSKHPSMSAGDVVETRTDVAIAALRGFAVTRRRVVASKRGHLGDRAVSQRVTVLHDGRMQLVIIALWPDGCEPLREAVELATRSLASTSRIDARHELKLIRHPSRT